MLIQRLRDAFLVSAVVGVLLSFLVALFTARVYGVSMAPTLQDGDALLVDKVGPRYKPPERGDIVLVAESGGSAFIKRVIAVPGDALEIDGTGPTPVVLIEPGGKGPWQRLEEPYTGASWKLKEFCCDGRGLAVTSTPEPLLLPRDRFVLLGDNRDASTDSRRYGLFSRDQIIGRVLFRWWPLARAGALSDRPRLVRA
ncbi:MAG TPA: signal peptidase I [Candidatus Dormibacteraeota bacterium]|nr:signal peptidase I [Candidatus Dormibacteraeota bacterium]